MANIALNQGPEDLINWSKHWAILVSICLVWKAGMGSKIYFYK